VHIDYRRPTGALDIEPVDDGDVYLALLAVRSFDGIVAVHCENTEITRYLLEDARASGAEGLAAWARARPPLSEASDVNNVVYIASTTGSRLLVVHVSASESLEVLARHSYDRISVEVLTRQLAMTAEDADTRVGRWGKVNPPLRDDANRDRLWDAVRAGTVDFVGTDHSAYSGEYDEGPRMDRPFWEPGPRANGGVGIALPMMLTEGLRRGLDLPHLSRLLSAGPAETFGLRSKGRVAVGYDADLVLVDLDTERAVESPAGSVPSIGEGMTLRGWPIWTMLRGRFTFGAGPSAGPGWATVVQSPDRAGS
jgi:dihydropyrimidinase